MADSIKIQNKKSILKLTKVLCFATGLAFFSQQLVLYSSALAMEAPEEGEHFPQFMPFKLGFEFQEYHNRCPWAASNRAIQKRPLFFVNDIQSDRKLWKVVIDGEDIEFVLEPFSYNNSDDNEEVLLNKAVESVLIACKPLNPKEFTQRHLRQALYDPKVMEMIPRAAFGLKVGVTLRESDNPELKASFDIWKDWLRTNKVYENLSDDDCVTQWHSDSYKPIQLDIIFKRANISLKTPLSFRQWYDGMREPLFQQGFAVEEVSERFPLVQDEEINIVGNIKFQPQATIQYPLEYSISLFFSCFGFKKDSSIITKLVHALPSLREMSQIPEDKSMEEYYTKKRSLVFLHALTLSSIISQNSTAPTLLDEIKDRYERTKQVDAKSLLNFMSRRPFSEMWEDVKSQENNFFTLYEDDMKRNPVFSQRFFKVSESGEIIEWVREKYPNYAEEFFSGNNRTNLSYLMDSFNFDFANENQDVLKSLLEDGILSTIMIHNFGSRVGVRTINHSEKTPQQIFEAFPQQSVQSIQTPTVRYTLDLANQSISEQEFQYDNFSPPWFLNDDDAMGFYKKIDPHEIQKYGEAIVELRMIKNARFNPGLFLTGEGRGLLSDVKQLYRFLTKINKSKVLSEKYKRGILNCILKSEGN